MRFALSDEQQLLKETVDRLAQTRDGSALWSALVDELGLAGLTIPTEYGGAGAGSVDLVVVLESLGLALASSPFFATVALGAKALAESGDADAKEEYLPLIAAGQLTSTLAHYESAHGHDIATQAELTQTGWRLTGVKTNVVDGSTADLLVVSALAGEVTRLFLVHRTEAESRAVVPLDATRPTADVLLRAAPARELEGGEGALARTLRSASLALAGESVGVAQWCLDTTVAYARSRIQFGRSIGSFQAIKHKLADMLMDVETSRAAVLYAAWADDEAVDGRDAMAELTAASVSDATFRVAAQSLQVLGGIGYTWEHPAHRYFKRARTSSVLLGSADEHHEAALGLLGV